MKKLFLKSILLICLTIIPVMLVNYAIDPLQCFRVATWYTPLYDSNQRMQNPCLAKTHEYDTVVIGTSNVENFDPVYIDDTLGGSTLRLAMAGSTFFEQKRLLELSLGTGKVKTVLWGIETSLLGDDPARVRDDVARFPAHFYDTGIRGKILYLLDPYLTKHTIKLIAYKLIGYNEQFSDLRYLNSWEHLFTFSKERALAFYDLVKNKDVQVMDVSTKILDSSENIEQNIFNIVKENPEVEFIIFFPPYSILRHVHLYEQNRAAFEIEWKLKEELIKELLPYENVRIFEFQHLDEITYDLENYKDLTHFSKKINTYVIDSFASGTHRLEPQISPTRFLSIVRDQVENFSLEQVE